MVRELTNFTIWGKGWFEDGWAGLGRFCARHGLAGVELLASGAEPDTAPPSELIEGVHLSSLGSWLPLVGVPVADYTTGTDRHAEVGSYRELVRRRAEELRAMSRFGPRYAVWHAAYGVRGGAAQTPALTAEEFLPRLATLVRDVAEEYTPPFALCFENAHGIGLDPEKGPEVGAFLDLLGSLEVGLALDIGHHLNRHRELDTAEAATGELHRVARGLRAAGVRTTVLHLHWTPPELVGADGPAVDEEPGDFFARSDQHNPLCHPALPEAVAPLSVQYVVHEMGAMTLEQHNAWLAAQTSALRGAPHGG